MAVRWPWISKTNHHDDGEPSFTIFYLVIVASGFSVAAMFGYLAEVASSHGFLLHAAGHSVVAAFGTITTSILGWQGLKPKRK